MAQIPPRHDFDDRGRSCRFSLTPMAAVVEYPAHTTAMRSRRTFLGICLALFALAALFSVSVRTADAHASHRVRHATRQAPLHSLNRRSAPIGHVNEISADDDDETADDDAATSLDVGAPPLGGWQVALVETRLFVTSARSPSAPARDHVHATRAPPAARLPLP